jgi:hypothetical protein
MQMAHQNMPHDLVGHGHGCGLPTPVLGFARIDPLRFLRFHRYPCCDGSDAKRVDAGDLESKDGHYRMRIDGAWVDVPKEAIVDGPNRAGRTMVWPYYQDGHPKARCFMPGNMS